MYRSKYDGLSLIIATALYLIPILVFAVRRNLWGRFKFSLLIKVLNLAFVIQLIEGITLFIAGIIVDHNIGDSSEINAFTEAFIVTVYSFLAIGMILYLPALVILNIINIARGKPKQPIKNA